MVLGVIEDRVGRLSRGWGVVMGYGVRSYVGINVEC